MDADVRRVDDLKAAYVTELYWNSFNIAVR